MKRVTKELIFFGYVFRRIQELRETDTINIYKGRTVFLLIDETDSLSDQAPCRIVIIRYDKNSNRMN